MGKALINVEHCMYTDDAILTQKLIDNFFFKKSFGVLTGYLSQYSVKDYLLDFIKCSPNNFGDLHTFTKLFSKKIGIKPPQVFVKQSSEIQALTYGNKDKAFIIITSKLIDTFSEDEIKFVLGHELGHIAAGHCEILTLTNILSNSSNAVIT